MYNVDLAAAQVRQLEEGVTAIPDGLNIARKKVCHLSALGFVNVQVKCY